MQTAVTEVGTRASDIISQKLLEFCHLLRASGIAVTSGRVLDAFRALEAIDCFEREDFYTALEANLISRSTDQELFRQLFFKFWHGPTWAIIPDPCLPNWEDGCKLSPPVVQHTTSLLESWNKPPENGHEEATKTVTLYSPTEILVRKDFGKMTGHELLRVQRFIMIMARQMATQFSRRKKAGGKARLIDPGRTMRRSLHYGGEVMEIVHRSRKKSKTKMVVLCDVSGSMNVYTQFLIQFLYGIQNALRGVETLVFSTRLTRITPLLRRRNIHAALALIADTVMDWSGGTKIGACLQEFNKTMAPNMVTSKTLVVIISDGWDTGDSAILKAAMEKLQTGAARVIWLNPLLGSSHYQPLCKGIQTALPYIRNFMPVHNVESLQKFGRLIGSLT